MITRDQITVPEFYQGYLKAVKDKELIPALKRNDKKFRKFLKEIPKVKRDFAYAEGKWTIRQLFQHLLDTERVFAFRALWFARRDPGALPGFDENHWAVSANRSKRKWRDMVEEFSALRKSTILLFESLSEDDLNSIGTANNNTLSAAAFGFVAAGHIEHHMRVIKTKYLAITMEQAI
jgi:hypothetical protein